MPQKFFFTAKKWKLFQENSSSFLQQSKWDWHYYSRERRNSQQKSQTGFTEVSELIDSAISKRQGDQRKHSFLERKKILLKRENGFTMSTSLDGSSYEATHSAVSQIVFSYLKMFSMPCRKIITIEDNKKRMNITNFINICTNIYTYNICDQNA